MTDKNKFSDAFRDCFLSQENESSDGWADVRDTLHRRAVTRKVATVATSLALIVAICVPWGLKDKDMETPVIAQVRMPEVQSDEPNAIDLPETVTTNTGHNKVPDENSFVNTPEIHEQAVLQQDETVENPEEQDIIAQEVEDAVSQYDSPMETGAFAANGKRLDATKMASGGKYQLGFSARGMLASTGSFSNLSSSVLGFLSKEWSAEKAGNPKSFSQSKFEYRHFMPVGAGISIGIPMWKHFFLETGLDYTFLHSERTAMGKTDQQYLHMLGIPLSFNWNKNLGKGFAFYAGAGTEVEKCLKATLGSQTYDEKKLQWSVFADFGFSYTICKNLSVYLQPEISYYFTDTELETFRSGSGVGVCARAGLRIGL